MIDLSTLVRQQFLWWQNLRTPEPLTLEPPERNSYPGLAWDSPLRRRQMEEIKMRREDLSDNNFLTPARKQ